jgi:hypothetical protein
VAHDNHKGRDTFGQSSGNQEGPNAMSHLIEGKSPLSYRIILLRKDNRAFIRRIEQRLLQEKLKTMRQSRREG